jgi:hypothetical protein
MVGFCDDGIDSSGLIKGRYLLIKYDITELC